MLQRLPRLSIVKHVFMVSVLYSYYCRYIKGRVTYDQVNNAVDEIHKVITAKYKILRLPRSAMGEPVMKKYKVNGHDCSYRIIVYTSIYQFEFEVLIAAPGG